MPYVMVPVPEEHVVDVMQYVTKLIVQSSREPWDQEAIEQFFFGANEGVRSLLSVVASATLTEKEITSGEAAKALELQLRDLGDILGPIGDAAQESNRHPIFESKPSSRVGPAGRKRSVRILVMQRDVAEMIRAAELKARELEPHPLDRDVG